MFNLITELQNNPSTLDKKSILGKATVNEKLAFKLCYDPFINSFIKKIPVPRSSGLYDFESTFLDFNTIYKKLDARILSGDNAKRAIQIFLERCDLNTQKVYSLILQKDLKCGISVKSLKDVFGSDFIFTFDIQLANEYDPEKIYKTDFWWSSPKLDGLRCYFKYDKAKKVLLTRGGNPILGFEELLKECEDLCEKYNFEFLDGELFSKDIPFQTIQSIVTTQKNIDYDLKKSINYVIFYAGDDNQTGHEVCLNVERLYLAQKTGSLSYKYIQFINYVLIKNELNVINELCKQYDEMGYEGLMLRNPNTVYSRKRSDDLLKFKLFMEGDFKVIGFNSGKAGTKYENTLGSIEVTGTATWKGKFYAITANVQGISEEMRNEVWNNQSKYLGQTLEAKYQNVTDKINPKTGLYSLRFPTFNKWKLD